MNIQEAVKTAMEKDGCIRRKKINSGMICSNTMIKPTNSYDCCILVIKGKENRQSRFWNPTADDLVADDWEVITE